MAQTTAAQIQRLYALGAGVGILESGNENDDLHALVFQKTGKSHISELDSSEYSTVERELFRLMRYGNRPAPLKNDKAKKGDGGRKMPAEVPGMITNAQKSKAWKLIYQLVELDPEGKATAGERMCGAIKKILDIEARPENPFLWVNFEAGRKLIEKLKMYVGTAEKRAAKKAAV